MKNKFKVKFGAVYFVLFAVIYALAAVSLVWNIIKVTDYIKTAINTTVFGYISLGLSIFLSVLFIFLITMVILTSSYSITESKMIVSFGILKESFDLSDITTVIKNIKRPSLSVIFKNGSAYKIMISENSFDDFYAAIVKNNVNVTYGETDEDQSGKR